MRAMPASLRFYEGTTQLQVVAAIRFVMNGAYLSHLRELEQQEVSEEMKELQARAAKNGRLV